MPKVSAEGAIRKSQERCESRTGEPQAFELEEAVDTIRAIRGLLLRGNVVMQSETIDQAAQRVVFAVSRSLGVHPAAASVPS
jgi:hypothetical protein